MDESDGDCFDIAVRYAHRVSGAFDMLILTHCQRTARTSCAYNAAATTARLFCV